MSIPLGKLSGRNALRQRLHEIGHELDDDRLATAFDAFKQMADTKGASAMTISSASSRV